MISGSVLPLTVEPGAALHALVTFKRLENGVL